MELIRELFRLQHKHGHLSETTLRAFSAEKNVPLYRLEELVSFYPHFRRTAAPKVTIQLCRDVCCRMAEGQSYSAQLFESFQHDPDVEIESVSCLGRCDSTPAAAVNDRPIAPFSMGEHEAMKAFIAHAREGNVYKADLEQTLLGKYRCDPYLYNDPNSHFGTILQLLSSRKNIAEHCIPVLKESGLKGMGGAGFPTGLKWELVGKEAATPKYVICNADESEPGTFKDREILRSLPHLVVEGMLLAGLTVGAKKGIVFLRHEYVPERENLAECLKYADDKGILGENAAGSGQRFDIEIFDSPGGYILGEETALLECLEDKRGEPRNKPPYPGSVGLWGKPTLINNVETFALATAIIHHGNDWWQNQGKDEFAGLKFVCISGDIENPGVYEIPVGTTVQELIDLAGGMRENRKLLAFLPGGASSNFLPAEKVATPLEFKAMQQAGSMLGTGAVVVFDETRNLFDLATNLVEFFRNESCGKCVPCRVGSEKAVQLLEAVEAGVTPATELLHLTELGETMELTSICGLGQVALNPVLSMLKHFPESVPHSGESPQMTGDSK